ELVSADRQTVEAWFRERVALRVTVVDYSMSGIRLIGARIAEARERPASYVLYEKGHVPLSVFMVPVKEAEGDLWGKRVTYRGHEYVTLERKGYRTVSWTEGRAIFGLVSMLDYDALLECADKLRAERARQAPLYPPPCGGSPRVPCLSLCRVAVTHLPAAPRTLTSH